MTNRAYLILVCLGVLVGLCMSSPGRAWEFGLKGTFYWSYEWYDQMGEKGFFGRYNVDNGTLLGDPPRLPVTQNLNFWNGGQFDTNFVTSLSRK